MNQLQSSFSVLLRDGSPVFIKKNNSNDIVLRPCWDCHTEQQKSAFCNLVQIGDWNNEEKEHPDQLVIKESVAEQWLQALLDRHQFLSSKRHYPKPELWAQIKTVPIYAGWGQRASGMVSHSSRHVTSVNDGLTQLRYGACGVTSKEHPSHDNHGSVYCLP